MERFGEIKKREVQCESDTGDKNSRRCTKVVGFYSFYSREKLEQGREFRSEDLQENNEREARKRQHNQLIIQNKQMQA